MRPSTAIYRERFRQNRSPHIRTFSYPQLQWNRQSLHRSWTIRDAMHPRVTQSPVHRCFHEFHKHQPRRRFRCNGDSVGRRRERPGSRHSVAIRQADLGRAAPTGSRRREPQDGCPTLPHSGHNDSRLWRSRPRHTFRFGGDHSELFAGDERFESSSSNHGDPARDE